MRKGTVSIDWTDLRRLQAGSERQRAAYAALVDSGVCDALAPYGPVLAGTIPLGIDLPESDLDVICEAGDPDGFAAHVRSAFGHLPGFALRRTVKQGLPSCVARFTVAGFAVEVFGQPRPAREQQAVRHLVAEGRLLALAGPGAAEAIRALKRQGLKTEPAFAAWLGLDGDPYERLLALAAAPDDELMRLLAQ